MKKFGQSAFLAFAAAIMASCDVEDPQPAYKWFPLDLSAEVGRLEEETRIELYNTEEDIRDKELILYGWEDEAMFIKGDTLSYSDGKWVFDGAEPLVKSSASYLYFASTAVSTNDAVSVSIDKSGVVLTVNDISAPAAQEDILLGRYSISKPTSGDVPLKFSHPFASVKFKLSAVDGVKCITAISISGLYGSGSTKLTVSDDGYEWENLGDADATITVPVGSVSKDSIAAFTVIPQDLDDCPVVMTVTYTDINGTVVRTITKVLNDGEWSSGCTTTYSLTHVEAVDIVEDSGEDMTVKNNGASNIYVRATITGAWYKDGVIVAPWNNTEAEGSFSGLPGSGWVESGEMFYYGEAVENAGQTKALYSDYTPSSVPVEGAVLKLDVLFQAIPYDSNKTCREAFEEASDAL